MLEIRNILVPTDLSERSEHAIEHAAALSLRFNAKLLCLHVVPPAPHEYQLLGRGPAPELAPEEIEQLGRRLRAQARTAAPACDVETLVAAGDPARRIAKVAKERAVDLTVMATRGHGRFRRFLLGSVVAKALHDLECPVLTGAHLGDEPAFRSIPYKTVACALALRDNGHSEKALRWAADFARFWSASLHVVHVPPSIDWGAGEWFPDETQTMVREAAREKLDALLAETGCQAAQVHLEGREAAPYVVQVAQDIGADVLVVGRSAAHGLLGGGGDAYAIIRESPCPVMSI